MGLTGVLILELELGMIGKTFLVLLLYIIFLTQFIFI